MPAGPDNPVTIPFNRPFLSGLELTYIEEAVARGQLSGDGWFTDQCHSWLEAALGTGCALLTHSGTAALEMAALLLDIGPGDEVIMPSYTFVSTANAVVLRGGVPVFVDIRADTLNIDETRIEQAITKRTRAILVVHYGGIACEMDAIMAIAQRHKLHVIEDAAHAILAAYKGRMLGTIGDLGCLSFHETKNITSGEGGALLVNRPGLVKRAEILRQKGTDRSAFQRGQVNKYTWVDLGSSFLPGEKTAAFLLAQLQQASSITARRRALWAHYHAAFQGAWQAGLVALPVVPEGCTQNGHLYHLLLSSTGQRTDFIDHMSGLGIITPFHYVPLHTSPAGLKYGRPGGSLDITTDVAGRLVRLPMWLGLEGRLQQAVIAAAQSILAAGSEPSVAGRVRA